MNKLDKIDRKIDKILAKIEQNTLTLKNVSINVLEKIEKSQNLLMRSILNVNEVSAPTTIVILPEKLTKLIVAEGLNYNMLTTACNFFSSFSKLMTGESNEFIEYFLVAKKCYLYLVDEVNHEVIIPDDSNSLYPIVIDRYPEFIKSIAPFLSIGFKLATMTTRFGLFLKKLGYPNLKMSSTAVTNIDTYISKLKKGSSIGEFTLLHKLVSSSIENKDDKESIKSTKGIDRAKAVHGAALRELTKFFTTNDPNGNFCDLKRVMIFSTGKCCWTTEETYRKLMEESEQDDASSETDELLSFEETSLMSITVTNQTNIEHYDDLNDSQLNASLDTIDDDDDVGVIKNNNNDGAYNLSVNKNDDDCGDGDNDDDDNDDDVDQQSCWREVS